MTPPPAPPARSDWIDSINLRPADALYRAEPPKPVPPPKVALTTPLRNGRTVEIVQALSRGDVRAARNLAANSPGLDWRTGCTKALAGLMDRKD